MIHSLIGHVEQRDGEIFVVTGEGDSGCVLFGPYMHLSPGSYEVEFFVLPAELDHDRTCCVVDVLRHGYAITVERDFSAGELVRRNGVVKLRFEVIASDTFEFRLLATGSVGLMARYRRKLNPLVALPPPATVPDT